MIKSEIISTIKNRLTRFDKTAKYHDRVLIAEAESVLSQMLREVFEMSPHNLQRYCKSYGNSAPLAVINEPATAIYYTTLPASVISIDDKASGVRRIAPATQTGSVFFPMDQREWDLVMRGSYVNSVKTRIGYIVTPTRVEYYGMTGTIIASGVRMDLLVPFSVYAETDVVPFPNHVDSNGMGFIDRVVERLTDKPTVDLLDNNQDIQK